MAENNSQICPNCGGAFSKMLPECPYCGTLNPYGAEKAYMDKLEKLKDSMGEMEDDLEEHYVRDLKKGGFRMGKVFLAIVIVILLMTAAIAGPNFFYNVRSQQESKEEIAFRKAYFEELDRLQAAGDDDAVLAYMDTLYEEKGSSALGSWKHYDYYYVYRQYLTVRMGQQDALSGDYDEKVTRDLLTDAAYYALRAKKDGADEMAYLRLTESEEEKVAQWYQEMADFLTVDLGLTEEEIDRLYEESLNKTHDYIEFQRFERVFTDLIDKR